MTNKNPKPENWRILIVEDTESAREDLELVLSEEEDLTLEFCADFEEATARLANQIYDLLILDLYEGQPSDDGNAKGLELLRNFRSNGVAPVVVWTALPHKAEGFEGPFIKIIGKIEGAIAVTPQIRALLDTQLPMIQRNVRSFLQEKLAEHMWKVAEKHWDDGAMGAMDASELKNYIFRQLEVDLRDATEEQQSDEDDSPVHPLWWYLLKQPNEATLRTGYIRKLDQWGASRIVLTPSCDLVLRRTKNSGGRTRKADLVLCATVKPLREVAGNKTSQAAIQKIMQNNGSNLQKGRYFYLPNAPGLDHSLVDLAELHHVQIDEMLGSRHVISLVSPYTEALVGQFVQFIGRVGIPSLDYDRLFEEYSTR